MTMKSGKNQPEMESGIGDPELKEFSSRAYQDEMSDRAVIDNIICVLGTGTGKTYIAVKTIRAMSYQTDHPWGHPKCKRTVFLVPSVPLVVQQAKVLRDMTGIPTGEYSGIKGVDEWTPENWHKEFRENRILVMVHDIFREVLQNAILRSDQINLLIFDECHHATKNHPYREILRTIHGCDHEKPRILGLTASVINIKLAKDTKDMEARTRKLLDDLEKEFHGLECCMNATVVTSYDPSLANFGARPEPIVEKYSLSALTGDTEDVWKYSGEFVEWLSYAIEASKTPKGLEGNLAEKAKKEHCLNLLRDVKNAFGQVRNTLRTMGAWCAYKTSQMLMNDLLLMRGRAIFGKDSLTPVCAAIASLQLFGTMLENSYQIKTLDVPEIIRDHNLMSSKVHKLLEIMRDSYRRNNDELCCIVFVTERYNSWALHMLLKKLSSHPSFAFIRSGFCVGQLEDSGTADPEFEKIGNSSKKFKLTVQKFRLNEINVLVATNVLEEGFDVPECSLIIRFDPPPNFRSYVQSKGRARAKNSKYIMMVDRENPGSFESDLAQFKYVDVELPRFCANRKKPTKQAQFEHFADNICEPVRSPISPAIIALNGALASLQRYCNTLPNDNMSANRIYPEEIYIGENRYQCRIYLPLSAAIKDPVVGPVMEDRLTAKKAAALKVCQLLLDVGELDPINLLPKTKDNWKEDLKDYTGGAPKEVVPEGQPAPGTTGRVQFYQKKIEEPFRYIPIDDSTLFFLHVIEYIPNKGGILPFVKNSVQGRIKMGILSLFEIPRLPTFPIYFQVEEYQVLLGAPVRISFTSGELLLIQQSHNKIFSNVLGLKQSGDIVFKPLETSTESILCVPLLSTSMQVDWESIQRLKDPDGFLEESLEKLQKRRPVAAELKDAVVACWYRGTEERFLVMEVREDRNPDTVVDVVKNQSPAESAREKYGVMVRHKEQPLIELQFCGKALNFLIPKPPEMKSDAKLKSLSFIPELFKILPVSQQFLIQCRLLPSVIHRIRQFCSATQLYTLLKSRTEIGIRVPTPNIWKPLLYDIRAQKSKSIITLEDSETSSPDSDKMLVDSDSSSMFSSESSPETDLEDEESPRLFFKDYTQRQFYKKKASREIQKVASLNQILAGILRPATSLPVVKPTVYFPPGCAPRLSNPPFSLDQEFLEIIADKPFPEVTSLLTALTTAKAGDFFNLERPETMGDSFLKMMTCIYLYLEYPKYHEGKLAFLKSNQVSNYNLYRLGKDKKIPEFVNNQFFEPKINFLPPGFTVIPNAQETHSPRLFQGIPDKSLADVMEALIGVVLNECGCGAAQKFMNWLGLRVMAQDNLNEEQMTSGRKWSVGSAIPRNVPSPLLRKPSDPLYKGSWERLISGLPEFQEKIGYRFREPAFLVQAFTHSSYVENRVTDCYQRLEFLGDAVLDFLVTRYLYNNDACLGPGKLTDLRSALVNNKTFSTLAAQNNFHNHIKYSNPRIFRLIKQFIDEKHKEDKSVLPVRDDMLDLGIEDDDDDDESDSELVVSENHGMAEDPKILGDVFESVAGAIFLDSGLSLDAVWKVYYNLMKETIDRAVEHCPKNPVRLLMEAEPANCKFGKSESFARNKVSVTVEVFGKGEFIGIGNNSRAAKCNAARNALLQLKHAQLKNMF